MQKITGNQMDNLLSGTKAGELLDAGGGNDIIRARLGDDTLYGRTGNDRLFGDAGNDKLYGGDGDDYMEGGAGIDVMAGQEGNDILFGRDGNDRLYGGAGNDTLVGGIGDDILNGSTGEDVMTGNHGADVFRFEFSIRDDAPETFVPFGGTETVITDFMQGADKLDMTELSHIFSAEDGDIDFFQRFDLSGLDTNEDGKFSAGDQAATVEGGSLQISLMNLPQIPGTELTGSITLAGVTELTVGDFLG